jgi:hypothetical protein
MLNKLACFTLDLEPDFLSKDSHEVLLDDNRFDQFKAFISRNHLKLTVFVVASMLESGLPVSERFENIETEFELHSFSHNIGEPDSKEEIIKGKETYVKYFGHPPYGYRAPNGDISTAGLKVLNQEGFFFDSSVFPAWRPELGYNYRHLPTCPWAFAEFPRLIELPFAAVRHIRLVISLSFLKLFGLRFFRLMYYLFGFPQTLIFDSHLYDFFLTQPVKNLSQLDWRRYALTRNQNNSFQLLQGFVDFLKSNDYVFVFMKDLYDSVVKPNESLPIISVSSFDNKATILPKKTSSKICIQK